MRYAGTTLSCWPAQNAAWRDLRVTVDCIPLDQIENVKFEVKDLVKSGPAVSSPKHSSSELRGAQISDHGRLASFRLRLPRLYQSCMSNVTLRCSRDTYTPVDRKCISPRATKMLEPLWSELHSGASSLRSCRLSPVFYNAYIDARVFYWQRLQKKRVFLMRDIFMLPG
jgi:hypothetical protein